MKKRYLLMIFSVLFLLFSNNAMAAEIEYAVPEGGDSVSKARVADSSVQEEEIEDGEDVNELNQPVLTGVKIVNPSTIKISWSSDGQCRGVYAIYRKKENSSFSLVGFVKATSATKYSYTDTTFIPQKKYTYSVRAIASTNLEEVSVKSSRSYSGSTVKEKLAWTTPSNGAVSRYLVFDGDNYVGQVSATGTSVYITYNSSYDPDFVVYALYKGGWGTYDKVGLSAKTTIPTSKVESTKLVATNRVRINWTRAKGVTGYKVYKRKKGTSSWTLVSTVKGEKQLYCYSGSIKAKTTYYFTVKPYVKQGGTTVYASYNKTGKKAYYKSVTVNPKSGDYSKGSVYGPSLSTSKLKEVKKAVTSYHKKYVTSDMTNLEKVIVAQLIMARYCTYADDWSKNGANTAWGSLVYKNKHGIHEAQCSGFARGFKALCDAMGVPCRYVHANSKSYNPSHQWNQVKIDGKWYIVDPQCNATSGYLAFFLCGRNTYRDCTGMRWNTSDYPTVASSDYSAEKFEKAWNGYKVNRIYNMLFEN